MSQNDPFEMLLKIYMYLCILCTCFLIDYFYLSIVSSLETIIYLNRRKFVLHFMKIRSRTPWSSTRNQLIKPVTRAADVVGSYKDISFHGFNVSSPPICGLWHSPRETNSIYFLTSLYFCFFENVVFLYLMHPIIILRVSTFVEPCVTRWGVGCWGVLGT